MSEENHKNDIDEMIRKSTCMATCAGATVALTALVVMPYTVGSKKGSHNITRERRHINKER